MKLEEYSLGQKNQNPLTFRTAFSIMRLNNVQGVAAMNKNISKNQKIGIYSLKS